MQEFSGSIHEYAHHDFGGVWRAPALAAIGSWKKPIDQVGQVGKVDVPRDDLQGIAKAFDLAFAGIIGEQVELQGASGFRHGNSGWGEDEG